MRFTLYIRDEDGETWNKIPNKSLYIHEVLNTSKEGITPSHDAGDKGKTGDDSGVPKNKGEGDKASPTFSGG